MTGARTEMVFCLFNCFGKLYVVNSKSLCNPVFVDKWSVGERARQPLPQNLEVTHTALDSETVGAFLRGVEGGY